MEIDVIIEAPEWREAGLEALALWAAKALAEHLGLGAGCEAVVLGCDDARITTLNGDFRDKAAPTNVLSWPSEDRDPNGSPPAGEELGDVAIAFQTCAREAADQGKPFSDHVTHLLVHGILHLLGYDHMCEKEAAEMERIEVEILAKLGVADPY
ncbi:rRNA maturation RNase YbeY [Candidatus Rhodobacter oscarellae]|nr:rRNA maturation RNase YbeY [Candidatus Rhodobacter lobularis]